MPLNYLSSEFPSDLSPQERFFLEVLDSDASNVLFIGAFHPTLSTHIYQKLDSNIEVYHVAPDNALPFKSPKPVTYLKGLWGGEDFDAFYEDAGEWDLVIINNIHEFWNGALDEITDLLGHLSEQGRLFFSFYNTSSAYEMVRNLPPIDVGYDRLGASIDAFPKMDLFSWIHLLGVLDLSADVIWGLLEDEFFQLCQDLPKEPKQLIHKGVPYRVGDIGDAFLIGAPFLGIAASRLTENSQKTSFKGIPLNPYLLQQALYSYLDPHRPGYTAFKYASELHDFKSTGITPFQKAFTKLIVSTIDLPNPNALVAPCRWGRDLQLFSAHCPDWKWTGTDWDYHALEHAKSLLNGEPVTLNEQPEAYKLSYADNEFDVLFSMMHFSSVSFSSVRKLAKEFLRVTKSHIIHFEDARGPTADMSLRTHPITEVYESLGCKTRLLPIEIGDEASGLYLLKVSV